MNALSFFLYTLLGYGKKATDLAGKSVDWYVEYFQRTKLLARGAALIAVVLLLVGTALGWIGYNGGIEWLEGVGRFTIVTSGMSVALFLTFLYLRLVIMVEAARAVTGGLNAFSDKLPALSKDRIENFLKFIRGYTAWIIFVCVYGQIIPVYRNLTLAFIVLTCFGFLAAAMGALWSDSERFRKMIITMTLVVLVVSTLGLAFPNASKSINNHVDATVASWGISSDNDVAIDKLENDAKKQRKQLEQNLIKELLVRKHEIEKRSRELCAVANPLPACEGAFLKGERQKYNALTKQIELIKSGKYFERHAGQVEPTVWQRTKSAVGLGDEKPALTKMQAPPPVHRLSPNGSGTVSSLIAPPPKLPPRPIAPNVPRDSTARLNPGQHQASPPQFRQPARPKIVTPKAKDDSFDRMLNDLDSKYGDIN